MELSGRRVEEGTEKQTTAESISKDSQQETQREPPPADASLLALCAIGRFHQIAAEPAFISHQLGIAPSAAASDQDILRAAKLIGLKAKLTRVNADRLHMAALPRLG
ncbi:MAG: hypothetical protein HC858_10185 [Brachymonas sp.]|nr:hypothetical protein [Brachymonas sp.]